MYGEPGLSEGEKTSALYDRDGSVTGVAETVIFAKESTQLIRDDCWFDEIMNGYICPRIRDYPMTTFKGWKNWADGGSNTYTTTDKYWVEIQRNDLYGTTPLTLRTNPEWGGDYWAPGMMSNESYHMHWFSSAPQEHVKLINGRLQKGDWLKVSYCLQGAQLSSVEQHETYGLSIGFGNSFGTGWLQYRNAPEERNNIVAATDMEHLDSIFDRPSWYFDGEWLTVKAVGEYDFTGAGEMIDENGNPVSYPANEHALCHKEYGCHTIAFTINNSRASQTRCSVLPEPANQGEQVPYRFVSSLVLIWSKLHV